MFIPIVCHEIAKYKLKTTPKNDSFPSHHKNTINTGIILKKKSGKPQKAKNET